MSHVSAAACLLSGFVMLCGCHRAKPAAPQPEPPRGYLNVLSLNTGYSEGERQKLQAAVKTVLAAHHFPLPEIMEGPAGTVWAVSSRPRSANEVSLAIVKMAPPNTAVVQITAYSLVGSDWAVLGQLFQATMRQEAGEMAKQIQDLLSLPK